MLCTALVCSVIFLCTAAVDLSKIYSHHAVLDPEEKMKLFWTVDWDEKSVSFAVEAETTGWVGFGISSGKGRMVASDLVIGWVKDGQGYLKDRFADARDVPAIDEQQDYTLTEFHENGGKTFLHFKRKFDTCDPRDRKIEEGTTKVVFAYHTEDPLNDNDMKKHTFRGSRSILLLSNMDTRSVDETGWKTFLLTSRNVTIPAYDTTYWCTLYKVPDVDTKHNIVKYEPYLQKGNEGLVHHLILYECGGNFTEHDFGVGINCFNYSNMPFTRCRWGPLLGGWAIGAEAFYWPPHAGYPIGVSKSPRYFLLELHYDNPKRISGRTDSSGLRIYYTSNTRKYDTAMFYAGADVRPWMMIPPKQESWTTTAYCHHNCTEGFLRSSTLPGGGVKIFSVFLHTHLAGRATWSTLIRNGKEIQQIASDDNYDFNFQDMHRLKREITMNPGDDIIHYCKYNTMNRTKFVPGGFSTREEMCLAFVMYYPAIPDFSYCTSNEFKPVYKFMDKYFPSVNVTSSWFNPLTVMDIKWNETMAADLQTFYEDTKVVNPTCFSSSTVESTEDPKNQVPKPQIDEPLPPKESPCQVSLSPPMAGSIAAFLLLFLSTMTISL